MAQKCIVEDVYCNVNYNSQKTHAISIHLNTMQSFINNIFKQNMY